MQVTEYISTIGCGSGFHSESNVNSRCMWSLKYSIHEIRRQQCLNKHNGQIDIPAEHGGQVEMCETVVGKHGYNKAGHRGLMLKYAV